MPPVEHTDAGRTAAVTGGWLFRMWPEILPQHSAVSVDIRDDQNVQRQEQYAGHERIEEQTECCVQHHQLVTCVESLAACVVDGYNRSYNSL